MKKWSLFFLTILFSSCATLIFNSASPAKITSPTPMQMLHEEEISLPLKNTLKMTRTGILNTFYAMQTKYSPAKKGQINLTVSLPWVNNFYLHPENETPKWHTGFMGTSLGLEYFYTNEKFIALNGTAVADFFIPFPAAVDLYGEWETMASFYISLTNNHKFRRFSLGYGMNFSRDIWAHHYRGGPEIPPPAREPVTKIYNTTGFVLDAYYQLSKNFHTGIIYRPSFMVFHQKPEFRYQHILSLELRWRIALRKAK